ncbi:MBL fold metallo-hydrolase, partial [bacterium J17]
MASKEKVRLTFYGAAQTVTGSKYLLEWGKFKILVDAGLFQGRKELRLRNWAVPEFDPAELDAIVLTHAHIDHSGYLPLLVKRGFKGPVFATPATIELLGLLLPDSAHLQEEEAKYNNKKGSASHKPAKPLYTVTEAKQALELLRPMARI